MMRLYVCVRLKIYYICKHMYELCKSVYVCMYNCLYE